MKQSDLTSVGRCAFCGGHAIDGFGAYKLADGRAFCGAAACAPAPRPDGAWRMGDRFIPEDARYSGGWTWWWWRYTLTSRDVLMMQTDDRDTSTAVFVWLELGDGPTIPLRADVLGRIYVVHDTSNAPTWARELTRVWLPDTHVDVLAPEAPAEGWRQQLREDPIGRVWWHHETEGHDRHFRSMRPQSLVQTRVGGPE